MVHEGSRLGDKIAPDGPLVNRWIWGVAEPENQVGTRQIARWAGEPLPGRRERRDEMLADLLSSRGGTRTPDPVINSHLLYQLSYSGSSNGVLLAPSAGQKLAARLRLGNEASAVYRIDPSTPSDRRICGPQRAPHACCTRQFGSTDQTVPLPLI